MRRRIIVGMLAVMGLLQGCGYNRLVSLQQEVDKQWAQVENVYQRRADLVPNLVATVSGAANFEKTTLTEITEARASVGKITVIPTPRPRTPRNSPNLKKPRALCRPPCPVCSSFRRTIPT